MALALSLRDAGIEDVEVYESTSTVNELGVGINVLPHAVRELTELGLLDDLYAIGVPTAELVYYSRHRQRIWGEPRGLAAGGGRGSGRRRHPRGRSGARLRCGRRSPGPHVFGGPRRHPAGGVRAVRDDGLAAFYEMNMGRVVVSQPISPLHQLLGRWVSETFVRGGVELAMGTKLHQVFLAAGLEAPRMCTDALIGGGNAFLDMTVQDEEEVPGYPLVPRRRGRAHLKLPVEDLVAPAVIWQADVILVRELARGSRSNARLMLLIYQLRWRDDDHTAMDVPAVSGSGQTHDLPSVGISSGNRKR